MAVGPVVHHIYHDDEYSGAYVAATEQDHDIFLQSLWRAYELFGVRKFDAFRLIEIIDGGESPHPIDKKLFELARENDLQNYPLMAADFTDTCETRTIGLATGANKKLRKRATALALVAARRRQLRLYDLQEGIKQHVDVYVVTADTKDEGDAKDSEDGDWDPDEWT